MAIPVLGALISASLLWSSTSLLGGIKNNDFRRRIEVKPWVTQSAVSQPANRTWSYRQGRPSMKQKPVAERKQRVRGRRNYGFRLSHSPSKPVHSRVPAVAGAPGLARAAQKGRLKNRFAIAGPTRGGSFKELAGVLSLVDINRFLFRSGRVVDAAIPVQQAGGEDR